MNKNDEKIMKLREKISEKKAKLIVDNERKRFVPVTNCRVPRKLPTPNAADGYYNINACTKGQLINILIEMNAYRISAASLGFDTSKLLYGMEFPLDDIIADIKAKIATYDYREEKHNLEVLETRLEELLSVDKQKELEIENIEKMLNGDL